MVGLNTNTIEQDNVTYSYHTSTPTKVKTKTTKTTIFVKCKVEKGSIQIVIIRCIIFEYKVHSLPKVYTISLHKKSQLLAVVHCFTFCIVFTSGVLT